jgi:hypothetical protein
LDSEDTFIVRLGEIARHPGNPVVRGYGFPLCRGCHAHTWVRRARSTASIRIGGVALGVVDGQIRAVTGLTVEMAPAEAHRNGATWDAADGHEASFEREQAKGSHTANVIDVRALGLQPLLLPFVLSLLFSVVAAIRLFRLALSRYATECASETQSDDQTGLRGATARHVRVCDRSG